MQENNSNPRNALQPGYELLWYKVKSVLGQGAFGITYLAQDINLNRLVAIKEFLPGQYAMRDGNETVRPVSEDLEEKFSWGLRRFIEEARILDQFEHPNIVRVMNIFEANNTAYMVMRYEQGVSLKEILIRQKFLDESDLLNILFPVLDGLEEIHEAGFIHRDIKPANIFIRTDGTPVLLDFGSARQSLEKETHTLTSLVSPGYAPIEQYVSKSDKQGPWSDIYGMAATLYRTVTGVPPNDAITRGESLTGNGEDNLISCRELADKRYSDHFIAAIEHGLKFLTRDRPQTIEEWKEEFLPLAGTGDPSQTVLSGHASNQVVSLVKESLTQTVTRIHDDSDLADYWDKDNSASVEMAHKQGFQYGLKVALALLTLIVSGLFIGNYQKIQQVVSPGFVPQDIISDEPVEMVQEEEIIQAEPVEVEPAIVESTTVEPARIEPEKDKPVVRINEPEVITETSPQVLDEQTAAELQAEGKIIIVDEVGNNDSLNVITDEGEQLDVLTGDELLFEDLPQEEISNQEIILDNESVIERNGVSPYPIQDNRDFKNPYITNVDSASTSNNKPSNSETSNISDIAIQEVYVPVRQEDPDDNVVDRFKNWVELMVTTGESPGHGKEPKDQPGGQMLEK